MSHFDPPNSLHPRHKSPPPEATPPGDVVRPEAKSTGGITDRTGGWPLVDGGHPGGTVLQ